MKIVIEIDNSIYDICKSVRNLPLDDNDIMSSLIIQSIANGTPLPKGHGRIVDMNKALDVLAIEWGYEGIEDDLESKVPTIIEAEGNTE